MWRYIEEYNYADTWLDPDDIWYKNEKFFTTLNKAFTYAIKQWSDTTSCKTLTAKDFKWNKKSKQWTFTCKGSYAPTLIIAKYE